MELAISFLFKTNLSLLSTIGIPLPSPLALASLVGIGTNDWCTTHDSNEDVLTVLKLLMYTRVASFCINRDMHEQRPDFSSIN